MKRRVILFLSQMVSSLLFLLLSLSSATVVKHVDDKQWLSLKALSTVSALAKPFVPSFDPATFVMLNLTEIEEYHEFNVIVALYNEWYHGIFCCN
jgi:predicted membrane protein